MGRLSFNGPMRKWKDLDDLTTKNENGGSTLKKGVDYEATVVFELDKPIKDIVGDDAKLISQKFILKNNTVFFYLNSENHEILIDRISYLKHDARLSIKLLNIPEGFTFKSVSILNHQQTIFVMLHKPDEDGRGKFLKAVKLDDIIKIEGDKIYYGD